MGEKRRWLNEKRAVPIVAILAIAFLGFVLLFGFAFFNRKMGQSTQSERLEYISEVSSQLTRGIDTMQGSFEQELASSADALEYVRPSTQNGLTSLLREVNTGQYLLIDDAGKAYSTDGTVVVIGDYYLASRIQGDAVITAFSSIGQTDDYMMLCKRIDPLVVGDRTYVSLVLAIPSQTFEDAMTVSLFDGVGAAYIIRPDGEVYARPENESLAIVGFNFYSSLMSAGGSSSEAEAMKSDMKSRSEGSITVNLSGQEWLVTYSPLQTSDASIVVAVPLSVTAAQTNKDGLTSILCLVGAIIAFASVFAFAVLEAFRQRREREANQAVAEAQAAFLSKMSHDLRTPLNAIVGMLELAGSPEHSRTEIDGYVKKARSSADYMLELINAVLDLQRINSGKMELDLKEFSLAHLLDEMSTVFGSAFEEKGITFKVDNQVPARSAYRGDPVKLKQILMNLLSNALKFTGTGGTVCLSAQTATMSDGTDNLTLRVADSGIGMSDQFKARLYHPFEQEQSSYTSKYAGSGLGLSIVKSLVDLMNGSVDVESELGKGTTFTIVVPLEQAALPEGEIEEMETAVVPFDGQRILLVEDNAINQQVTAMLLTERMNLVVDTVNNGKEALDRVEQSSPGYYAAILMDIKMPVMDGLEATRAIRALDRPDAKSVPIVALSANTFKEDVDLSLSAGMNGHLGKPIDLIETSHELHRHIK